MPSVLALAITLFVRSPAPQCCGFCLLVSGQHEISLGHLAPQSIEARLCVRETASKLDNPDTALLA